METANDVADEGDRLSEEGGPDPVENEVQEQPPFRLPDVASLRTGFTFVESVNLVEVFQERVCVIKSVFPRTLLRRGPRGGGIPRPKLLERFEMFVRGQWDNLLEASRVCGDKAAVARR